MEQPGLADGREFQEIRLGAVLEVGRAHRYQVGGVGLASRGGGGRDIARQGLEWEGELPAVEEDARHGPVVLELELVALPLEGEHGALVL